MEIEDDREKMPEYDESIFYPERAALALGFTMEDLEQIVEYFRWHLRQKELQDKKPIDTLIQVLRARQKQLIERRRLELLEELSSFEKYK